MSHALLHDREVMDAEGVLKDQTTKEVEAESIAYIVCNHFGLDTFRIFLYLYCQLV